MLYRIVLVIFLSSISFSLFAQRKKVQYDLGYDNKFLHLGISLGFHSLDYRVLHSNSFLDTSLTPNIYSIEPISTIGINIAIISNIKLNKYVDMRFLPGMLLGQRNLKFGIIESTSNATVIQDSIMTIPAIYLDFPLLFKFKAKRINNYRPYLICGGAIKYNLETKQITNKKYGYTINQDPLEFFYEFGFGIDWFLYYIKLATEIKLSLGTKNILIHDASPYSNAIESLKSRMVIVSFHLE